MKTLKANRISHFAQGEEFPTPQQAANRALFESQTMKESKHTPKIKAYANRYGSFGLVEYDSTLVGSAADLASARTREFADVMVERFNTQPDLIKQLDALKDALKTWLSIYPENLRQHPDIKIACEQTRAALASVESEGV